ncbi:MAG: dihydrodipicolinate synthase family protein [Pseudomonadota bacterium]
MSAALVTPVDSAGDVQLRKLVDHAHWVLGNGCDGIVLFGTTGESASFSPDARSAALDAFVGAGVPPETVMVGTGCCSIAETVRLSRQALDLGCQGVLIHPPFFFKNPSEDGIFAFYARVIDALGRDDAKIYLYHFPDVTGVPLTLSLIERLLNDFSPVITGIKDSSGSFENMKALVSSFSELAVYSGDDHLLWPLLEAGGAGAITATANLIPNLLRDVADGWQSNSPAAQAAQATLVGLWEDTLLKFPVSEAVKELIADLSEDPGWRTVCPPLEPLPSLRRQQLLSLADPFLEAIPSGLGTSH